MTRASLASAEPLPVELAWDAPPGCPGASDVLTHLASIIEEASPRTHVEAHGTITRIGKDEFRLVVEATAGNVKGLRTITAPTCGSLGRAAAIIIGAVLADEERDAREGAGGGDATPPPSSPSPSSPPPVAVEPQATTVPSPSRPSQGPPPRPSDPSDVSWRIGLAGAVDVGTLPRAALGMGLSAVVALRWVEFGGRGSAYLPEEVTFDTPSRPAARFSRFDVAGYGCVPFGTAEFHAGPCAEVGVSSISVTGLRLPSASVTTITVPLVATGLFLDARLTRALRTTLRLDAVFPVDAPPIGLRTAEGPIRLHELALPAFRALFGLELTLR